MWCPTHHRFLIQYGGGFVHTLTWWGVPTKTVLLFWNTTDGGGTIAIATGCGGGWTTVTVLLLVQTIRGGATTVTGDGTATGRGGQCAGGGGFVRSRWNRSMAFASFSSTAFSTMPGISARIAVLLDAILSNIVA